MNQEFTKWFPIKEVLHYTKERAFFNEGEVWMANVGINIGFEVNGKSNNGEDFLRPVLIFRKLSHYTFIGIPLTSKEKNGDWYYPIEIKKRKGVLMFNQVQSVDAKRLKYRMERLDEKKLLDIKVAFKNFI